MLSDKLALAKVVIRWTSVIGSSKIVHDVIQNNVTTVTIADQAKVLVGSFVLGSMISDQISKFTDAKFDEIVAKVKEVQEKEKLASR